MINDCVHRGVLLTRSCGCHGDRQKQDDIYRCWLNGDAGQCVPVAQVLDPKALAFAGYRMCQSCEHRQEPVRLEPTEQPRVDSVPYERRPVRWEDHRERVAKRRGKSETAWVGETDIYATTPTVSVPPVVLSNTTHDCHPLIVYRVDTSHCASNFHQFNASILRWRSDLVMAYRHGWGGATIRVCSLDGNYVALNDRQLRIPRTPYNDLGNEDPRLFVYRGHPCVSYNGVTRMAGSLRTHMMYSVLHPESLEVTATYVLNYPGRRAWEKNWTFFERDGELCAIYDLYPETVVLQIDGYYAEEVSRVPAPEGMESYCGYPRGGASPVLVDDELWCFYHGVHDVNGRKTYGLSVCVVELHKPHRITKVFPGCLLWANEEDRWAPHHPSVVYPAGAVYQRGMWLVSMGYQDRWSELAVFSHASLAEAMVTTGTPACHSDA